MEVTRILAEIDAQIAKLQQARSLLSGEATKGPGRPKKSVTASTKAAPVQQKRKRNLSADARKRIAEAQKRRWAERRKSAA